MTALSSTDVASTPGRDASWATLEAADTPCEPPLVVDLDGTLIRGDLLVETAFAHVAQVPLRALALVAALAKGKAALKARIAQDTAVKASALPYDPEILTLIHAARAGGRRVYLASASNERYVAAVAAHLKIFDGWFASTRDHNLTGRAKAERLVAAFGARGFDYIGNDRSDLAVWKMARRAIAVRASSSVQTALTAFAPDATFLRARSGALRDWVKLLRVHQWSKSALVAIPLVTAHHFDHAAFAKVVVAMVCFSFAASGIYIINDLADVEADRAHPTKHRRPLATGMVPALDALLVAAGLVLVAVTAAFLVAPTFGLVILGYLCLSTAYTFSLKRKMMVDVVVLAALYTIRVIGGAAAIAVPVSEWLLAFSMFIFTALALMKRYVELATLIDGDLPNPSNRNDQKSDLEVVGALAVAAAFNGVTVFTLYISSDTVHHLYRRPDMLWLMCPVLMYWLGRLMIMAHRRLVTDDPVIFALRDRNSLLCAVAMGAIVLGAM